MFVAKISGMFAKSRPFAKHFRQFSSIPEASVSHRFVKRLPLIGVCIGSVALTFQLTVLYPWHDELSEQFDELQKTVLALEETASQLESRMNAIVTMENEVKVKERRILTTADDILSAESTMSEKLDIVLKNIRNQ